MLEKLMLYLIVSLNLKYDPKLEKKITNRTSKRIKAIRRTTTRAIELVICFLLVSNPYLQKSTYLQRKIYYTIYDIQLR